MGLVFVAEQAGPVGRNVALRVIKPGTDSKAVVARFEAERQAVALMDRSDIAGILGGGTTDSGRPYFVHPGRPRPATGPGRTREVLGHDVGRPPSLALRAAPKNRSGLCGATTSGPTESNLPEPGGTVCYGLASRFD